MVCAGATSCEASRDRRNALRSGMTKARSLQRGTIRPATVALFHYARTGGNAKGMARKFCGALAIGMVLAGGRQVSAEDLPERSGAARLSVLEIGSQTSHQHARAQVSENSTVGARVVVDRAASGALIRRDRGIDVGLATENRSAAVAQLTLGGTPAGAQVSASRTTDIVGRPIDIFRPIRIGGPLPSGMPVATRAVTSGFGWRVHPVLGGLRAHSGVDLAAPYGTPIVATTDGVVGAAGTRGGYGLFVAVEHGNLETRYGHMSRLNVVAGQRVRKGDVIGYVGSTGRSTGPHLHYEVRVNGRAVDPLPQKTK